MPLSPAEKQKRYRTRQKNINKKLLALKQENRTLKQQILFLQNLLTKKETL